MDADALPHQEEDLPRVTQVRPGKCSCVGTDEAEDLQGLGLAPGADQCEREVVAEARRPPVARFERGGQLQPCLDMPLDPGPGHRALPDPRLVVQRVLGDRVQGQSTQR